jgi:hypothetical protein
MMSFFDCLDEMQTSFIMIAALIPDGLNKQLKGHLQGISSCRIVEYRRAKQWRNEGGGKSCQRNSDSDV